MTNSTPTDSNTISTLDALLALGETGRTARSERRPMRSIESTDTSWLGEVVGANGRVVWRPRIKVVGKRSFGCTCPDHQKQRGAKGPCKHVISLAGAAKDEIETLAMFERHANMD